MFKEILAHASVLAQAGISLWFVVWAIRRKGEMDEKLDRPSKVVRWVIVYSGWILMSIPGRFFWLPRAIAGALSLAFLCWPNFAYHLTKSVRRHKMHSRSDDVS